MASDSIRPAAATETAPLREGAAAEVAATSRRGRRGTFDSLSDRSFRWFFFSMASWFAAMNMSQLVNGYIVYDLTGSYAALGMVSLATAVPMLLLSLPGGVIADRFVKQRVIQLGQIVNTLVAGSLAVLMLSGALIFEFLLVTAVIQGLVFALIMPSRQTMIADVVSDEQLMNGVALNSAGQNVMRLGAPSLGGVLLTVVGAGWVYVLMTFFYVVSALCMIPVRSRAGADRRSGSADVAAKKHSAGGVKEIIEGCRYIWHDKTVLMILVTNCVIVFLAMPIQQILPGFTKEVLGSGGIGLGVIMSLIGLGSLLGSLVVASMSAQKRGAMLMVSGVILGVSLLIFSLSSMLWLSAIMAVVLGIGQAGRIAISSVLLQTYTPSEYRGRVMSVYMMQFSFVAFGTFLVGIMAGALGVQVALAMTGVALLVFSVVTFVAMPKMWKLE